jgi:hypothetical protein
MHRSRRSGDTRRAASFSNIGSEKRSPTSSTTLINRSMSSLSSFATQIANGGWRNQSCTTTGPLSRAGVPNDMKRNEGMPFRFRARTLSREERNGQVDGFR